MKDREEESPLVEVVGKVRPEKMSKRDRRAAGYRRKRPMRRS